MTVRGLIDIMEGDRQDLWGLALEARMRYITTFAVYLA